MKTFDLVSVASDAGISLSIDGQFRLKDGRPISESCLQSIASAAIAAERREICLQLLSEMKHDESGTIAKWHNKTIKQCVSMIRSR